MVNFICRTFVELTERVVRQFSKVHDRIKPLDIFGGHPAHVLGESQRPWAVVVVEPAVAIKAAIRPDDVEPLLHEPRPNNGADIPVGSSYQYPHSGYLLCAENCNSCITKVWL